MTDGAAACRALLATRVAAIPAHLEALLATPATVLDGAAWRGDPAAWRFAVTGGGLSESPARFLVGVLNERLGLRAAFVPQSEFAARVAPVAGDTLVAFSQGLAPNALLPLAHAAAFARVLLFSSVAPAATAAPGSAARRAADLDAAGVRVLTLPPAEETGLLLRVVGAPVATLAALRFADELARRLGVAPLDDALAAAPSAYRAPAPAASLVRDGRLDPVALVAPGRYAELAHGLRWKLLEGLHLPDPPIWDVLQVAHGPFQSIYPQPHTLLVLERDTMPHEAPLIERLGRMLRHPRHRVIRLRATLPGPLAYFEHDAQLDALLLDALARCPIDLADWPGKGEDGPIYDVAPDTLVD